MSISYTKNTLDNLEYLLGLLGYKVRYEKGNFKTGACILENTRVIVVNKFSDIDNKINSLIEMLRQVDTGETLIDEKQKEYLYFIKQIST